MKAFVRSLLVMMALTLVAAACGGEDGTIAVDDARYRIATSDLGAGYLTITNTTSDAVTLEAASADGVGRIELHESFAADNGTMAMEARPEGFVVEAGETISLEPGGKHLMIFDPAGTEDLTVELDFGDEVIPVVVAYDAEASAAVLDDADHADHGDDHSDDADHDDGVDHGDDADHDPDAMEDGAMEDGAMEDGAMEEDS